MVLDILRKKYIGEVLLSKKYITKEQLSEALKESSDKKQKVGSILVQNGYISDEQLFECLSISLGVEYRKLNDIEIKREVLELIQEKLARRYLTVPLEIKDNTLVVAMADPANVVYKDDISRIVSKRLSVVLSSEKEILAFIEKFYASDFLAKSTPIEEEDNNVVVNEEQEVSNESVDPVDNSESASIIKYISSMISDAITKKASDIHLEPFEKEVSLRIRVDGVLQPMSSPSKKDYSAIVSEIKVMSNLNVLETNLPQDGKCVIKVSNQTVDIRVSVLPTIWGEKVVLKIFSKNSVAPKIEEVGFSSTESDLFKRAITSSSGMVLVTGPTDSGKTSTLYSALEHINSEKINIMTAEESVDFYVKGINQCQIKEDSGLTFASALKSFMRQDPNVILIGEIKDSETAKIAVQVATNGHLVFSTLYTGDTINTISKMLFMGIEPYLLAEALNLVIAQRLIRTICPKCKKEKDNIPDEIYGKLGLDKSVKIYEGAGCEFCEGTGYKGRTAIFEMLEMTKDLKFAISKGATIVELQEIAQKQGLISLRKAAIDKLVEGKTTIEEVFSATIAEK